MMHASVTETLEVDAVVGLAGSERQPSGIWTWEMGCYCLVSFFNNGRKGKFRERSLIVKCS